MPSISIWRNNEYQSYSRKAKKDNKIRSLISKIGDSNSTVQVSNLSLFKILIERSNVNK